MRFPIFCATALIAISGSLVSCGGGGGSATTTPATSLAYTAPSSGDYQLVKNASSTSTQLVLDLVGPVSTSLSGVGFYLTVDSSKASWSSVGTGLASSSAFTNPLVKSQASGGTLQVGIYQLGTTAAITSNSSTVLATVALDLKSGVASGSTISLSAPSGKALILNPPGSSSATTAISISIGSLVAK